MKKLPQHLDDSLLDYLDGKLSLEQRASFEKILMADASLQKRLEELQLVESTLRDQPLEQPSKNFTTTVMSRLDQYPVRSGLSLRNGILLLSGIIIVMVMTVTLVSAGVFDEKTTLDLNNVGLAQRYIKQTLPTIPINGKMMVNTIILLNLALAFVVLDRAILKPFFQRRMQAGH